MPTGNFGCWAQKSGDFKAKQFDGTQAGLDAAIAYCSPNGVVSVFPGSAGVIVPATPGSIPDGVRVTVYEGGRVATFGAAYDNFNHTRIDPILNVKDYPTFQAAHDALPSTGGTIYVPAGSYTHGTKPAFGSATTAGMVITKPGVTVLGEGQHLTFVRNFASPTNNQHGFDIRESATTLRGLYVDGSGLAGTGSGVIWHKAGATCTNLYLDSVYIDRQPSWSLQTWPDYAQSLTKVYLNDCQFGNAKSGGDWLCGSSGASDNIRVTRCEFSSPSYGGYMSLYPVDIATSGNHLSATDLTAIAVGDYVVGPGIPAFAKVATVNTAGATDFATLDLPPTVAGSAKVCSFRRPTMVAPFTAPWLPCGTVHLIRAANVRFQGCGWQGPCASSGLGIDGISSNIYLDMAYREYATPFTGPLPWITTWSLVENLCMDKFVMQSNVADPKLFQTGSFALGAGAALQQGRFSHGYVVSSGTPSMAGVVSLGSPDDDFELEACFGTSSSTGARYPLVISGAGAGFIPVASTTGTMTLPNATSPVFKVTGTSAIPSITAQHRGRVVTLVFASTASLTSGSNLLLSGNFTGAANKTIQLLCDGTNWLELPART